MTRRIVSMLIAATLSAGSLSAFAGSDPVAIDGYCPVAYVAADKAVRGSPDHVVEHEGHTWQFVNAEAKSAFEKNPDAFGVGYDGWCATAIAFGQKVAADPQVFTVYEGETYLFSNAEAKAAFDADPAGFVAKADKAWKALGTH